MPTAGTLALFLAAATLFAVAPGPAVLYIVTRSLGQGSWAGVASALDVATGNLLYVGAGVLGLTAVLAASATAFTVVKYAGAAYLVYLGVRTLTARDTDEPEPTATVPDVWSVYRQGVVVAALNPKTALFFLAFLPQFVAADRGPVGPQVAVLGVVLVAVTLLSDTGYALLAGTAGSWLRRHRRERRTTRYATGSAYIALGVTAALAGQRR